MLRRRIAVLKIWLFSSLCKDLHPNNFSNLTLWRRSRGMHDGEADNQQYLFGREACGDVLQRIPWFPCPAVWAESHNKMHFPESQDLRSGSIPPVPRQQEPLGHSRELRRMVDKYIGVGGVWIGFVFAQGVKKIFSFPTRYFCMKSKYQS